METSIRVDEGALRRFLVRAFERLDLTNEDAAIAADVLIKADLRGVHTHGVSKFRKPFIGFRPSGIINPRPDIRILSETRATALIDGDGGAGSVVGMKSMSHCIRKASEAGAAFVAVKNTTHFGMAAYYSMMALPHNMIGICLAQAGSCVVPIYGTKGMYGTNPISIAVPANKEFPFIFDMSVSVVAGSKIEYASQKGTPIPLGWALDRDGNGTTDGQVAWDAFALLPLGGTVEMGGHKGYGLGLMVDILTGILSGSGINSAVKGVASSHFFGALRIDAFRSLGDFKSMMDDMIGAIKASPKAPGHDRIYIPGERGFEAEEDAKKHGIPLDPQAFDLLRQAAVQLDIPLDL